MAHTNTSASGSVLFQHALSTAEKVELGYQLIFAIVAAPVNIWSLWRQEQMLRWCKYKPTRRMINMTVHLSIANLLAACVHCVWRSVWFMTVVWRGGDLACKLYSFISVFGFHAWANIVVAIGIEKVLAVRSPLRSQHRSQKNTNSVLMGAWSFALVCSAPMLLFRGVQPIPDTPYEQCTLHSIFKQMHYYGIAFHVFHVLTVFYIPLIAIFTCYISIFVMLLRRRLAMDTINKESKEGKHDKAQLGREQEEDDQRSPMLSTAIPLMSNASSALVPLTPGPRHSQSNIELSAEQKGTLTRKSRDQLTIEAPVIRKTSSRRRAANKLRKMLSVGQRSREGSNQDITDVPGVEDNDLIKDTRQSLMALLRTPVLIMRRMNRHRQQRRTHNRFVRTAAAIIGTFVLSWLPYQLLALVPVFCSRENALHCDQQVRQYRWLEACMLAGACVNPLLYRFGYESRKQRRRAHVVATRAKTTGF